MSDMEKRDEAMAAESINANPSADKPNKTAKKDKSAKKDNKPGVLKRASNWFREMRSELKKVSWPSGKDTMKNIGTVISCVVVVGVFIWAFDWLTHAVIQAFLNLF